MTKAITILQLDQNTAAEQVALFNKVFNSKRLESDWLYKHRDNPLSSQYNVFGAVKDEKIIGLNGFMPMHYQIGNQLIKAIQSCDSAVDPDYRGQGIFTKIVSFAETYYRKMNIDFMLGFPNNNNSFPGLIKMEWLHLLDAHLISLPCKITSFLEMKFKIQFLKMFDKFVGIFWYKINKIANKCDGIKVIASDISPFTEYEHINCKNMLNFRKTPEILKWKLDNNPHNKFRYYVAQKNNKNISYFIVEERGVSQRSGVQWVRIIDWFHLSEDIDVLTCSFAKILLELKQYADFISLWMPTENVYRDVFKKFNFIQINILFPINPVVIKVLTDDFLVNRLIKDKNNWQPKLIETDTLL